jgi:hypothetical protein
MRIQLCYSAFSSFGGHFRKKYGLTRVSRNLDDPCIFFGLYGSQVERMLAHRGLAVVVWAGTDAVQFKRNSLYVDSMKAKDNVRVIAISDYVAYDMDQIGVEYIKLPILPMNNSDIKPAPLGDSMYIYRPNSLKYGRKITKEIRRRLPHINVIEGKPSKYGREDLLEMYKQCFISLRPVTHDGCSNTVAEMGLMGRPSVWNGGAPHALTWENVDDVEEHVVTLYDNRKEYDWEGMAKQAYDHYNIGDNFLYTEFYE